MARPWGTMNWRSGAEGLGGDAREGAPVVPAHLSAFRAGSFGSAHEGDPVERGIAQGGEGPQAAGVARAD